MSSTILRAGTLLLARNSGDVGGDADPAASDPAAGLYVADTRLLARWALRVDGVLLRVAGSQDGSSRRILALVLPGRRHEPSPFLVRRVQEVGPRGLEERIDVTNVSREDRTVTLTLEALVDFADQFAVRADGRVFDTTAAERGGEQTADGVRFTYRHTSGGRTFAAAMGITAAPAPVVAPPVGGATTLTWTIPLRARERWELQIRVWRDLAGAENGAETLTQVSLEPGEGSGRGPSGHDEVTAADRLALRRRSLADLKALLLPSPVSPGRVVIGAGAPWFLTLFGRDGLLTSELLAARNPQLAADVLRDLALTQGVRDDPASLEQPGRIVHEVRRSELATLGMVPFGRYYGSVDATPLFLAVLGRAARRPGGRELAVDLEEAARGAVAWMRGPGGIDASGFLRFTPDPAGLLNQGWKDSPGSTCFADGSPAEGAIALCEVQGYAWEGLTAVARLAREVWGDARYAAELEATAADLRERFSASFWMHGQDFPALALDGADRQVDTLASNAGHLLWSGILPADQAAAVIRRLLSPAFFTGWGLRTVAAGQVPYAPLSYHNGSVWPHDTMLTALGMLTYGEAAGARVLARGVTAAGRLLGNRLPELFAGLAADDPPFPVTLERAGVPQAWAAAAGVVAADLLESTAGP